MHIAVLDDNIADRKQIERLLDRESDRRISTTGNLYTDTFGAVDAFLASPRQYDFFMIDLNGGALECVEIAVKIRDLGIKVPICFFKSKDEFAGMENMPAYKRIFLLGPSHHEWLDGASVNTEADYYATPLGNVAVDREIGRQRVLLSARSPRS